MNYNIVFIPEFYIDLKEAFDWYEMQQQDLGIAFLSCIEAELARISRNPQFYSFHKNNVRRALINKFPFGIFFEIKEQTIVIYSVFDMRRNPKSLRL